MFQDQKDGECVMRETLRCGSPKVERELLESLAFLDHMQFEDPGFDGAWRDFIEVEAGEGEDLDEGGIITSDRSTA